MDLPSPEGLAAQAEDARARTLTLIQGLEDAQLLGPRLPSVNPLSSIHRELGADFELTAWRHRAFCDEALGRTARHLVSQRERTVRAAPEGP